VPPDPAFPSEDQPALRMNHVTSIESLQREWSELAFRTQNIFATCEWASIWWKRFGGDRPLAISTFRSSGDVVALVPLYLWSKKGLRVLRLVGHGVGGESGPVCASERVSSISSLLERALAGSPWRWDVFLGEHLFGDVDWTSLHAKMLRRAPSPVLRTNEDWRGFLKSRNANIGGQLARYERDLRNEYKFRYRLADDPERLPEDLDALFALHAARWGGRSSAFLTQEDFHRDFARCALERGWLRLWFIELNGRAVAASYGFRYAGVQIDYQAGWDPSFGSLSVDSILLTHTIREALNDGVHTYRFLRGGDAYKRRFATENPGVVTFGIGRGPVGKAMLETASAVHRFQPLRGIVKTMIAT
jgi:CelD/BcsL family acetyltransferase involved in cellulose biosynthesis